MNRLPTVSKMHLGSLRKSPKTGGLLRMNSGARWKNWLYAVGAVSRVPAVLYTANAVFTPSRTNPLPTHRAWSGGSRLNCVLVYAPVPASRWSTWFRPAKPAAPPAEAETGVPAGDGRTRAGPLIAEGWPNSRERTTS